MNRIMIVGCCGSGKSTLARKLNDILEIELFHLDQYYWKPNWEETNSLEWKKIVNDIVDKDSWIIDGNYKGTMDARINRADTIIMLNYSTSKCMFRVIKRILLNWKKVRFDMPKGCKERFDLEFLKYVWNFKKSQGLELVEKLKKLENQKNILIVTKDNQLKQFTTRTKKYDKIKE